MSSGASSSTTSLRAAGRPHNAHHRSSEVFSAGAFSRRCPSTSLSPPPRIGEQIDATKFDISMVRPMTIEDAIKRMQRVPSVEFACSFTNKKPTSTDGDSLQTFDCNSQLARSTASLRQNDSFEEEDDEGRDKVAPSLPANGGPYLSNYIRGRFVSPGQLSQHHAESQLSLSYSRPPEEYQIPASTQCQPSSNNFLPSDRQQWERCYSLKRMSGAYNVNQRASTSSTPGVNYSTGPPLSLKRITSANSSVRSNAGGTAAAGPGGISAVPSVRRSTVARLGSESGDSDSYFVPRESWLTSLYVKLPKSKSLFRLQLELLNLPLFASVHRFLEDTCTTTTDQKALLEENSFLFALFNQYVPHARIPVESLSKYIGRLQKYEILATIEFNFLKTPSLNRRGTSTSRGSSTLGAGHSLSLPATSSNGKARYSRHRYALSSSSTCSMRQARKGENAAKNTNQRYVPYDYNRVVLRLKDPFSPKSKSDYINASHIDSLLKPNAYIVAQAPNETTLGDFWCLLWQQKVHVIVMLTKVYEFIRVMCTPYWPLQLNTPEVFDGQFEVTLVDEDKLADYIVRTMKVRPLKRAKGKTKAKALLASQQPTCSKSIPPEDLIEQIESSEASKVRKESENPNEDEEECRTVYQLHFTSWNINSCPYSDSILKFRRRVQIYEKQCSSSDPSGPGSPLLVHCSNGCGRSGAYVCLDANLQLAEEEGTVDIFAYSRALRKARVSMIENLEQYKFIYETIEESYVCGKTWFHVREISNQMKNKAVKSAETKRNEYQNEFEKLMKMTSKFSIGDCAGGHRLENRYKNRDVSIVPPDNFRPYLTSFQCNDHTDYINAVFVDGYSRPREYIVTEWPLKRTIPDIWSLIYDHDCNTVVVLGGLPPKQEKTYPQFWPREHTAGKAVKYGPIFTVETISSNSPPNISSWVLRVNKKVTSLTELMAGIKAEPKITQVFEFGAWPYDYKVPTSTNALVELIHMVERWRQRTSYGPVLVVSGNGKSRVGVYCAANFAIEQVVAHEEIDIFNAVKTVRRHRSSLIETIMEYKYCYDLTLHYVSHFMCKSNYNQIFRKNL